MNRQKNSLDKRIKIGRALALAFLSICALVFTMASIAEPLQATNTTAETLTDAVSGDPGETVTPTTTAIMGATAMPSTTLTMTPTKLTPLPSTTPVMTPTVTMTSTPAITPTGAMTATETPTAIPTVPTVPAPVTSTVTLTDIVISEVFYQGDVTGQDSAADDWIELQNLGGDIIDVSTWWICIRGDYTAFADLTIIFGDLVLSPGEILVLQAPSDLLQESDLAIYAGPNGSTPNFGNPAHLIDFIQWGSPINQGRADLAVQKGIWTESNPDVYDFVPIAGAGQSAALVNGRGTTAADYANGAPSQGNSNPAPLAPLFYFLPFVDSRNSS